MKAILKSYPESKDYFIAQVFIPEQGWVSPWGVNLVPLTEGNLESAKQKGATHLNIMLTDQFDTQRFPDFSLKELEK